MQGRQKLHHLAAVVVPLLLSFCAVDDWLAGLEPDVDPALLLVRGSAVAEAGRAPLPAAIEDALLSALVDDVSCNILCILNCMAYSAPQHCHNLHALHASGIWSRH